MTKPKPKMTKSNSKKKKHNKRAATRSTRLRQPAANLSSANPAANRALQQGRKYRAQGEMEEATKAFQAAVAADANFVEAYNDLGDSYLEQQRFIEAQNAFQSALNLNPTHSLALNNFGALMARMGNLDQAINYFEQALEANPKNINARENLETAYGDAASRNIHDFESTALSADFGHPTISLCLITKNEAENLPALFDSLRAAVDEIIVVDTGSTDDTVEIARQYDAKVFHFEWCDDFAAAKNEALKHASGDWILTLDADMEAEAGHALKIRRAVASGISGCYYINIRSLREDGFTVEIVSHPWLFENVAGIKFTGRIHEFLLKSLIEQGLQAVKTNINITRFGYADESGNKDRSERDLRILESETKSGHAGAMQDFYLARSYLRAGRLVEAVERLRSVASSNDTLWRQRANAYHLLMTHVGDVEGKEAAIATVEETLRLFPEDRQSWATAEMVYRRYDELDKACDCLIRALTIPQYFGAEGVVLERTDAQLTMLLARNLTLLERYADASLHLQRAIDKGNETAELYCALGQTSKSLSELEQAEAAFHTAVRLDPKFAETHRQLGFLYAETNRPQPGLQEFALAVEYGIADEELLDAMDALAEALGDNQSVRRACERASASDHANDAIRARLGEEPHDAAARAQELAKRARVLYRAEKWDMSAVKYEQAIRLAPLTENWCNELGVCLMSLGESELAMRYFRAELAINPKNDQALFNLGLMLVQTGKTKQAVGCFELALKINPKNDEARTRLSQVTPLHTLSGNGARL